MFFLIKVLTGGIGWWIASKILPIGKRIRSQKPALEDYSKPFYTHYRWIEFLTVVAIIGLGLGLGAMFTGMVDNRIAEVDAIMTMKEGELGSYIGGMFVAIAFGFVIWCGIAYLFYQKRQFWNFLWFTQLYHNFRSFVLAGLISMLSIPISILVYGQSTTNFWVFEENRFYRGDLEEYILYSRVDSISYGTYYENWQGEPEEADEPFYSVYVGDEAVLDFQYKNLVDPQTKLEILTLIAEKSGVSVP
ncbi:MAG: hypothetical protein AAFY71_07185 [Bacteroidota bacterium]